MEEFEVAAGGLITNPTAPMLVSAVEFINWYRCRWEIETLFHVLKKGFRVEALQLDSQAKLELAMYLVVSWRIAHAVRLGRIHPTSRPICSSPSLNGPGRTSSTRRNRPNSRTRCAMWCA